MNGYMSYVRHQRAGIQEYGDKKMHEDGMGYNVDNYDDNDIDFRR